MSVFKQIYDKSLGNIEADARLDNNAIFTTLYEIFESVLISSFRWNGLPEWIYYTRPEQYQFYRGLIAGFIDEKDENKFKIFPAFGAGNLRQDGFMSKYQMNGFNGDVWIKSYDEIVLGENNSAQMPTQFIMVQFVDRMQKCLRAVDNGITRAAFAQILGCDNEQQVREIVEAYNKQKDNMPFVATMSKTFTDGQIQRVSLFDDREFNLAQIWNTYDRYKHEFYTFFGINNTESEKPERMVKDEVNANNEIIVSGFYDDMFQHRTSFCDRCNTKFGVSLSVEKNRVMIPDTMQDEAKYDDRTEVPENGDISDNGV